MADEAFHGIAMAVGVQADATTVNATIRDLAGAPLVADETDGFILGDRESGDAASGISSPSLEAIFREVQAVAASRTERADTFQKVTATGFAVAFLMQGNGDDSGAPDAGAADMATLFPGYEAIYEMIGLIGANGANPIVEYTSRHDGSTGGAGADGVIVHGTIKVWMGDLAVVFEDCVVTSAVLASTPGGNVLCTVNIQVGVIDTANIDDGIAFPTITYDAMEDLAAPIVEGVAFAAFGQTRGHENLTITITNEITVFGDSNASISGERQVHSRRVITVDGTLYVNATDSKAALDNLIDTSPPTDDLSFQVGTVSGASDVLNAFKIEVNNLQAKAIKYVPLGEAMAVEITGAKATATSAGAEFKLTFN